MILVFDISMKAPDILWRKEQESCSDPTIPRKLGFKNLGGSSGNRFGPR